MQYVVIVLAGLLMCLLCLPHGICAAAEGEESGPDLVVVAEPENPEPGVLPGIRVAREKLWDKYFPMLSVTFPNVPEFACDSWCYEAEVDFLDARALDGGRVEMRHRDRQNRQALVITTATPRPGSVVVEARMELDREGYPAATLPAAPTGLNLCWQLRHAPGFASKPDPYPEFVRRCFIFTERGRTFLLDTDRKKIPVQKPDSEHNTPPWVQMYMDARLPVPETPPNSWAGFSADRYLTPVIGAVSRDGKFLAAIANDSADSMAQAWHDCMHNNPKWLPEDAPVAERRWRLGIYAMENNPKALLGRVAEDFPKEKRPAAAGEVPTARPGWKPCSTRAGWVEISEKAQWMKSVPLGPFVRLADNRILGVSENQVLVSDDEGDSWEARPLFGAGQNLRVATERAMIRTKKRTIILVFMNMADYQWAWNAEKSLPEPDTRLDVWAIRSLDEGQTWVDAQMIYDGYCGDIHHMLETSNGTVVAPVQELLYEDGRHALRPRYSADGGKTWQRANLLDIGGRGHHDGLIEGTLAELADGRLWLLCRTNLQRFWSAYSDNHGEDWRFLQPSDIPASSSPGTFAHLASGRLMLVWNRPIPDGGNEVPDEAWAGGDNQWSDVRVSNYRAELSVAFSSDDGKTWSTPAVLARRHDAPGTSLAYSYVFEAQPGEIWVTTMQGDLRLSFHEADFLR
ncbi:MAG: exo-alpha-sialidase [Candidatus Hydrogenedentes bacterium]|nr:exo-alpha-sialidase [Candidatus Hydrogenedentota bacterium]